MSAQDAIILLCGDHMISALVSRSSSPALATLCCVSGQDTVLSQWVPANLMLGSNPAIDNHPIHGEVEILLVASCHRNPEISAGLMGNLACMQINRDSCKAILD